MIVYLNKRHGSLLENLNLDQLISTNFHAILSVLNLFYAFSKRSIFINYLSSDKKQAILPKHLVKDQY